MASGQVLICACREISRRAARNRQVSMNAGTEVFKRRVRGSGSNVAGRTEESKEENQRKAYANAQTRPAVKWRKSHHHVHKSCGFSADGLSDVPDN